MTDIPVFWAAIAIVVIIFLWRRRQHPRRRTDLMVDVERDLLRACRGDTATAERLIRHELDGKPDLSRSGAALMALSRLRNDQR
jgi:hypothetical protein